MSIVLTFQSSEGDRRVSKGPYTSIRLEGEVMRERHGGPAIASHFAEGWWQVDGEDYLRVDSEGRVVVLWEGSPAKGTRATTGHFSSVDGVAYIDRRILAFIDLERHDWYLKRQGEHKPVLVLVPCQTT
jgi:hypothetical protein